MNNNSIDNDMETLREDILTKLTLLRNRDVKVANVNNLFMSLGLDSSNTYKALRSKVRNLESGDVLKTLRDLLTLINQELAKNVKFNNKRAYFYKFSNEKLELLFELLKTVDNEKIKKGSHDYIDYTLSNEGELTTSNFIDDGDFKLVFLKSLRNCTRTERIDEKISLIEEEDEKVVRLTKVTEYVMNAFDFIAFDFKNEVLVIGMDLTSIFPKAETEKAAGQILDKLKGLCSIRHIEAKDLRNCVENFEAEEIGDVLDHSFMTESGGYNHSGKSMTNSQDARNSFHKDGLKGKKADFYGVVKAYTPINCEKDEKVILSIRLTYRDYKKDKVTKIRYSILNGVRTIEGLKYSIYKVLEHNHN